MSSSSNEATTASVKRVAYIMSRFPKLTETFIVNEILAMERQGLSIDIYPLRRERAQVMHPEAVRLVGRAKFQSLFSIAVLLANVYWLCRRPISYVGLWMDCLKATLGSARYFFGSIAVIPLAARFAYRMRADGIEHVHAHFVSHPAVAGFAIARLTGIPFSFTAHGSDLHREHRMLREKLDACQLAVTVSDFNRDWMVDKCGESYRDKIHVVHCGVRMPEFSAISSTDKMEQFDVLCIGSLHEVKGQSFLIRACARLVGNGLNCRLHLIGDGPDRTELERLADENNISNQVVFHGPLTRGDVFKRIQQADLVVVPSVVSSDGRREGIPVVLMEAMASRRPVVASRISGIPELVEHEVTGLLVPPGNVGALAGAIERLHGDEKLRERLAERGRKRVEQAFDLDSESGKLARLFTSRHTSPTHPNALAIQQVS